MKTTFPNNRTFACESGDSERGSLVLALSVVTLIATIGALNGGVALTAATWDAIVTVIKAQLQSSFVLAMVFIVLVVVVWQIGHGRGYQQAGLILGIFVFALIGPGVVTSVSTSLPETALDSAVASPSPEGALMMHYSTVVNSNSPAVYLR